MYVGECGGDDDGGGLWGGKRRPLRASVAKLSVQCLSVPGSLRSYLTCCKLYAYLLQYMEVR